MKDGKLEIFNFLASHEATLSFAPGPPGKNRCVLRIGDDLVAIEYATAQSDALLSGLVAVCQALKETFDG